MIICFVDYDGVTHHFYSQSRRDPELNGFFVYLPRLEKVLRDYPEVMVVISSEWRNHHPLDELRSYWSEDMRDRIIGTTFLEPRTENLIPGRRQRQVEDFLKVRGLADARWFALDDEWEHYRQDANVVRCDDGFFDAEERMMRETIDRLRTEAGTSPAP